MAVTANQIVNRADGKRVAIPVYEATTIYEGTAVFLNSSGFAVGGTGSGANAFAGIAVAGVVNAGASGAAVVEVWQEGTFLLTGAGTFTQGDVGKDAFMSDNYTLAVADGASTVRVGKVVEFHSATRLWVKIDAGQHKQQAALTAQLTTITHTAPGTPDYAVQNLTNSSGYGFVTADEGNSVLSVIANLQVRVAEIEARLKALNVIA